MNKEIPQIESIPTFLERLGLGMAIFAAGCVAVAGAVKLVGFRFFTDEKVSALVAAWVQAIGVPLAILVTLWVATYQVRAQREAEIARVEHEKVEEYRRQLRDARDRLADHHATSNILGYALNSMDGAVPRHGGSVSSVVSSAKIAAPAFEKFGNEDISRLPAVIASSAARVSQALSAVGVGLEMVTGALSPAKTANEAAALEAYQSLLRASLHNCVVHARIVEQEIRKIDNDPTYLRTGLTQTISPVDDWDYLTYQQRNPVKKARPTVAH